MCFGYIKPIKAELKVKEWEAYQRDLLRAFRKQLAKRYGFCQNDLKLWLCISANAGYGTAWKTDSLLREHCIVHPFKTQLLHLQRKSGTLLRCSVMLCYHKLEDDLYDEGFAKRLAVQLIFRLQKEIIKQHFPSAACRKLRQQMQEQQKLEEQHCHR